MPDGLGDEAQHGLDELRRIASFEQGRQHDARGKPAP